MIIAEKSFPKVYVHKYKTRNIYKVSVLSILVSC